MDLCALMVRLERTLGMPVDVIPTDSIPAEYLGMIREHEVLIYER
jgi:predicted nucleotidyltransferase